MARKSRTPNFDQALETLRANGFEAAPWPGLAGAMLVSKDRAAAVLVADTTGVAAAAFAQPPGALVQGEVGSILDRGYQKFIKTAKFEIPASAGQLHSIHQFSEELKLLTGVLSLFNESLGSTSDLYQYDRLKGRDHAQSAGARPWEQAGAH